MMLIDGHHATHSAPLGFKARVAEVVLIVEFENA
jgi:hypothetical protein